MSESERLPKSLKFICLSIVRDYERQRREYLRKRREILDGFPTARYVTYTVNGEERREYPPASHGASRTAENVALRLAALEQSRAVEQMRAVEHARARIGSGMPDALADTLREAILLNCQSGRTWPFERLYVTGVSRSDFFRHRDAFLADIAAELGLF